MKINVSSFQAFRSRLNCAFFIGCVLIAATATRAEAGYTFMLIADTTGPIKAFNPVPAVSLNASGTVAFVGRFDTMGRASAVFTGNGGVLTTIATAPFGYPFDPPSINQAGMVAFKSADRILAGNGGPLVTIADTAGQFRGFPAGYSASINTAGTVAFTAFLDAGGGGIFARNGEATTPILIWAPPFGSDNSISLNDAGTVAFRAYFQTGAITGVATLNGGVVTTIADSTGPFNYFGAAPSLNEAGTVAFVAGKNGGDGGAFGIYKGNGGVLTTIADLSGPFSAFSNDFISNQPSINDAGDVVFTAGLDAGGAGIFIGDGIDTNEVIGIGDALFGSTVATFSISPTSLNDSGQVAFYYRLANGTTGIAIATPVPEPSVTLLLTLSLALRLTGRARSQRAAP